MIRNIFGFKGVSYIYIHCFITKYAKRGAKVTHCIVAEGVTVGCDAVIGEKPAEDVTGDVATIAPGVTIGDRAVIGPKAMVYNDVEEGQEQC